MDTTTQRQSDEGAEGEAEEHEAKHQELPQPNQALIELLNQWDEEDAEEQRATLEFLMKALDEDRPSYRKLFP